MFDRFRHHLPYQLVAVSRSRKDPKARTSKASPASSCNNYEANVLHPADFLCFGYICYRLNLLAITESTPISMTEGRIRDVDFGAADSIQGNTTKRTKWRVLSWLHTFTFRGTGFGNRIGSRAKITEISVNRMLNEPEKMEGKVIAEITITEGTLQNESLERIGNTHRRNVDMINTLGAMHAGCTMYLIDMQVSPLKCMILTCRRRLHRLSTLPLSALDSEQGGTRHPGVSQALHTVFHAPAPLYVSCRLTM